MDRPNNRGVLGADRSIHPFHPPHDFNEKSKLVVKNLQLLYRSYVNILKQEKSNSRLSIYLASIMLKLAKKYDGLVRLWNS